jgi:glycosyltransferase involved in cell wall biosynthesis
VDTLMRILHTNMLRGWGGQSNRVLEDIHAALADGHEVALAVPQGARLQERCRDLPVAIWPGFRFKPPVQLWHSLPDLVRLRRHLAEWRPDLIHVHGSQDTWLVVVAAALARGNFPPIVRTKHNFFDWRPSRANRWLYRRIDGFIPISTAIERQIVEFPGLAGKPRRLVPSVPDFAQLDAGATLPAPEIPGRPPGAFLWGSTGRMRDEKAHDVLLRAFERVRRQRPDSFLVIAGGGSLLHDMRTLAQQLGLGPDAVWLPGQRDDIPSLLRTFDAYALASRTEGLGTAILEALAVGLPVVATNVGGIPDSVHHERTGLLVPPDDPDALSVAMLRLMDDEPLRRRLATDGAAFVRSAFTADNLRRQTMGLYQDVLERRAPRTPSMR